MLRTPARTRIRWQLQWHAVWRQPGLGSANVHTPDDTSNDTLCDSHPQQRIHKICEPSPPTWSKNPIAKAIWGISHKKNQDLLMKQNKNVS